ncbi:MAG: hypothetical protein BGP02_10675 [Pandoraea sp. 64-18]|nr:MAG: hypothetical protein BGP02_10675 [Pandoraea sp. 64-18]
MGVPRERDAEEDWDDGDDGDSEVLAVRAGMADSVLPRYDHANARGGRRSEEDALGNPGVATSIRHGAFRQIYRRRYARIVICDKLRRDDDVIP